MVAETPRTKPWCVRVLLLLRCYFFSASDRGPEPG